jgi:CRISPR type III-A-associated RAMP protein Csm5
MTSGLFKVECLTPVHVGSGDELVRGVDFYSEAGFTEVLDPELVLRRLGGLEGFAESLQRGADIGDFFRSRRISAEECRLYRVQGLIEAQKLRLAIRVGDGRAMIPGSSMKGAIRTLLLAGWTGEQGPHSGKRSAPARQALSRLGSGRPSQALEEAVFHFSRDGLRANDPRTDVLRTLSLSDAPFAPGTLKVVSSIALGTRRTTLTALEVLETRSAALLRLKLGDSFLTGRLPFPNPVPDFETLAAWSRQHAGHLIRADIDFFKKHDCAAVVERLERLIVQIDNFASDAVILRLGWGTGWRTMTGDILTPDERSTVMIRVGKTRKVIIDTHSSRGRPCDLLGWVRIEPISGEGAFALAAASRPSPYMPEVAPASEIAQRPAEQVFASARDPFDGRVADLKAKDWGKVGTLYEQAASHSDRNERDRRLKLLAGRLQEVFGRDRRRMREIARMEALAGYLIRQ